MGIVSCVSFLLRFCCHAYQKKKKDCCHTYQNKSYLLTKKQWPYCDNKGWYRFSDSFKWLLSMDFLIKIYFENSRFGRPSLHKILGVCSFP
jgi:hypothetical protein